MVSATTRFPGGFAAFVSGEPYRVLFPLGAFWAVVGVLLWPALYAGWLGAHPGVAHPRIMIEGFLGAFVFGFLGTAGPRFLGTPRFTAWELSALILLHTASMTAHTLIRCGLGDTLFLCALAVFGLGLLTRAVFLRKDDPPPPMVMAVLGLGSAFAGLLGLKILALTGGDPGLSRFFHLLIYQGFLLLPILGIGTFFFPRLLGVPMRETGLRKTLLCAAAVTGSFAVESWVSPAAGLLLRAGAVGSFLLVSIPWNGLSLGRFGSLATALKCAVVLGVAGLLGAAWMPLRHLAFEHLLYAGCFGLLTFVVASRVVLGHSGEGDFAAGKLTAVRIVLGLAVLAALTRLSADFLPRVTPTHYLYAALVWSAATIVWVFWLRRSFLKVDPD